MKMNANALQYDRLMNFGRLSWIQCTGNRVLAQGRFRRVAELILMGNFRIAATPAGKGAAAAAPPLAR
jgi:hypothetical protein